MAGSGLAPRLTPAQPRRTIAAGPRLEPGADAATQAPLPAPFDPAEGDTELLGDFVVEAMEHLENADIHLLKLETDPDDTEALNSVFRAFHTIKGVAGFLALDQILSLSHEAENLLDKARKGELILAGATIDVTFDAADTLKRLIGHLREALSSQGLMLPDPEVLKQVAFIQAAASGYPMEEPLPADPSVYGKRLGTALVESGLASQEAVVASLKQQIDQPGPAKLGDIMVESSMISRRDVDEALARQSCASRDRKRLGESLALEGSASEEDVAEALRKQQQGNEKPKLGEVLVRSGEVKAKEVARTIRAQRSQPSASAEKIREVVKVDAERLDGLVDTIGELVIAESMVSQSPEFTKNASPDLLRLMSQLDKITRNLQEQGTSLRMVSLRSTFQKMARLVRDLAKKSGKQVDFVMSGEDTELDKTVVDNIGDPLVHMVRNAVDHGLEDSPEARRAAGKSEIGRIELRAFHKGGSIVIEIEDDGKGLDRDAILAKAQDRGLIQNGDAMSDREVWNLIFEPGFSTAKEVTAISGRGVGMDVVRKNVEALRGHVAIHSKPGKGSIFSIRAPLTLAIIDGMIVRVHKDRYVIPTISIMKSIRPERKDLKTVLNKGEMLILQDGLIPLFRVDRIFGLRGDLDDPAQGIVVVVEHDGQRTGLVVDELLGQRQIVIKSLGEAMVGVPGISGGAIMPDGKVGLIIDVSGIVELAHSEKAVRDSKKIVAVAKRKTEALVECSQHAAS